MCGGIDEIIAAIDTTMASAQQGPLTQARAQQLNYQVKSFLVVQKSSSSPNGVHEPD